MINKFLLKVSSFYQQGKITKEMRNELCKDIEHHNYNKLIDDITQRLDGEVCTALLQLI